MRLKISLGLLITVIAACGFFTKIRDKGIIDSNSFSVFQTYAGKSCRMTDEPGKHSLKLDCQNLRKFLDANSASCKDGPFTPAKAYFPDNSTPIQLCRDNSNPDRVKKERIRFIATADTGDGQNVDEGAEQFSVADAMHQMCFGQAGEDSCDFILVSGDLIYPKGVENVFDGQLRDKFEKPYEAFGRFDFYMVPGNHDYLGNVTADVEYTYFSDRWRMYDRHFSIPDLPEWLAIYGLDTSAMVGDPGSNDTSAEQAAAYKKYMCGSKATWKLLFGHHPTISHGSHGSNDEAAKKITSMWHECPFNLYLTAHDHIQEHVHAKLFDVIIQGGGGADLHSGTKTDGQIEHGDAELGRETFTQRFFDVTHGFALIDITASEMHVRFYATDKWAPKNGVFTKPVSIKDVIYECTWKAGSKDGCVP